MKSAYQSKYVTDEQIQAMKDLLVQAKEEEQEIALAEQAGMDMSAARATLNASKEQALKFLAVYGQGKK